MTDYIDPPLKYRYINLYFGGKQIIPFPCAFPSVFFLSVSLSFFLLSFLPSFLSFFFTSFPPPPPPLPPPPSSPSSSSSSRDETSHAGWEVSLGRKWAESCLLNPRHSISTVAPWGQSGVTLTGLRDVFTGVGLWQVLRRSWGSGILGPVSWRPTTVKWRQFSKSSRHSTRQTEYYEALPSSAYDEVRCDCTFADDGNALWY